MVLLFLKFVDPHDDTQEAQCWSALYTLEWSSQSFLESTCEVYFHLYVHLTDPFTRVRICSCYAVLTVYTDLTLSREIPHYATLYAMIPYRCNWVWCRTRVFCHVSSGSHCSSPMPALLNQLTDSIAQVKSSWVAGVKNNDANNAPTHTSKPTVQNQGTPPPPEIRVSETHTLER